MDIQERMSAFAGLGAGWVLWLLVLLSIIGLAIVLERFYYFFSTRGDFGPLRQDVIAALRNADLKKALARLKESPSVEARIVEAGIEAVDEGPDAVEELMAGASAQAKIQMERNLAFLGTVGNNAPFIGLLGTVIGIIRAFVALKAGGGQVTDALYQEVGEALVATAIGILVAIPAVAFFNLLGRIARNRLAQADTLGHDLLAHLKRSDGASSAKASK